MFRLQFGNRAMGRNEVAALMSKLPKEKIVKSCGGDAVSRGNRETGSRARVSRGSMVDDGVNWRTKARRAALLLRRGRMPFAALGSSAAYAQSIMRTPSLHINSRVPTINPTVAPRINPTVSPAGQRMPSVAWRNSVAVSTIARTRATAAGRRHDSVMRTRPARSRVGSGTPYARYSHNLYPVCEYANRGPDGECFDRPLISSGAAAAALSPPKRAAADRAIRRTPRSTCARCGTNSWPKSTARCRRIETPTRRLARSHGLERIASQNFPLVGGTVGLFRIIDRRPADTVRREFAADARVKSVQPNFRYVLQDQKKTLTEGDPAQYAVAQLRLPQAHTLARGMNVTIAVIDSGIDVKHPELANSIADSFDALGSKEGPHVHGTGIAGAIVAHARLMGSAPEARLLAIRAFGVRRAVRKARPT